MDISLDAFIKLTASAGGLWENELEAKEETSLDFAAVLRESGFLRPET